MRYEKVPRKIMIKVLRLSCKKLYHILRAVPSPLVSMYDRESGFRHHHNAYVMGRGMLRVGLSTYLDM